MGALLHLECANHLRRVRALRPSPFRGVSSCRHPDVRECFTGWSSTARVCAAAGGVGGGDGARGLHRHVPCPCSVGPQVPPIAHVPPPTLTFPPDSRPNTPTTMAKTAASLDRMRTKPAAGSRVQHTDGGKGKIIGVNSHGRGKARTYDLLMDDGRHIYGASREHFVVSMNGSLAVALAMGAAAAAAPAPAPGSPYNVGMASPWADYDELDPFDQSNPPLAMAQAASASAAAAPPVPPAPPPSPTVLVALAAAPAALPAMALVSPGALHAPVSPSQQGLAALSPVAPVAMQALFQTGPVASSPVSESAQASLIQALDGTVGPLMCGRIKSWGKQMGN